MLTAARTHIMIDVETLGVKPGSIVIQIAAAVFDPLGDEIGDKFSINIDPVSSRELGLTVDQKTIDWWDSQGKEVKKAVFAKGVHVRDGITEFSRWIGKTAPAPVIWAHGATFDPVLLQCVFEKLEFRLPWSYLDVRDTRTIFDLVGLKNILAFQDDALMKHDALTDVITQAKAVQYAFSKIGVSSD